MESAKRHLSAGFDLLDSIEFRLKGAELDRMALARQEFRQAYAALEKEQKVAAAEKAANEAAKAEVKKNG